MGTEMPGRAESRRLALDRLPLRAQQGVYHAVIEAPAGSRNKCKFEPALGVMVLHKVLPLGLSYPYSFGFIPRTEGDDGDPLDVLVLMDAQHRLTGRAPGRAHDRTNSVRRP